MRKIKRQLNLLGVWLFRELAIRGMNKAEFAKLLHISPAALTDKIRGEKRYETMWENRIWFSAVLEEYDRRMREALKAGSHKVVVFNDYNVSKRNQKRDA